MEEKLLETLQGYRDAARKLKNEVRTAELGNEIPAEVQLALLRFAAAMSLNERLSLCEEFLSEETPDEVAEAFYEAQEEIARAIDSAFHEVDSYASYTEEFQQQIDMLSADSESSGLLDDLLKLYKCEGIIRMAYESAQKYAVIGTPAYTMMRFEGQDEGAATGPEQYLLDKAGVDVYALMEIRGKLVDDVRRALGDAGREKE